MNMISTVKSPYPIEPAFLDFDKERTLSKAAKRLEDKGVNEILIVHVSTSSYSSHHEEVRYLAGLSKRLAGYDGDSGETAPGHDREICRIIRAWMTIRSLLK